MHQPSRDRHPRGNRRDGDRIGWRQDRGEREGDRKRYRRDHPVDQKADQDHREHDKPKRQFQDHRLVAKQPFFGNAPAVKKQQRRQKQQKEEMRIELHRRSGHAGDCGTKRDLHQRQRNGDRRKPGKRSAQNHGEKQDQGNGDAFHGGTPIRSGSGLNRKWEWMRQGPGRGMRPLRPAQSLLQAKHRGFEWRQIMRNDVQDDPCHQNNCTDAASILSFSIG